MAIREGGGGPALSFGDVEQQTAPPFHGWLASAPVTDTPMPQVLSGDTRNLPDAFSVGWAGCVSPRLRDVLEASEPQTHQFFPLDDEDGNRVAYIFHVTQSVACVLATESGMRAKGVVKHGPKAGCPYYLCHDAELAISAPAMGGHRIFSTVAIAPGSLIVPDEVAEALMQWQTDAFRIHPVRLSQTPWVLEEQAPELAAYLDEGGAL